MIYFDNNATTPLSTEVRDAMMPYLTEAFGNPSSVHAPGNRARVAVDGSRKKIAAILGVTAGELVFTGCGSEANNMALIGALLTHFKQGRKGKNLVISAIEHPAVKETARWAADTFGFQLRVVPIKHDGRAIDVTPFHEAVDQDTVLVSVMTANNETGIILPVKQIFSLARSVGALCHTDAVQCLGKMAVKPGDLGADLLSFSAHKFHGPKGIGGLYIRRGVKLEPLIHGGPQENVRRAGTENVAYIVGMACAAESADQTEPSQIADVRDYFEARMVAHYGDRVTINFSGLPRTPNTSSIRFEKKDGNLLLIKLDRGGVCISTGAACSSGSLSPSKGLMAMGLNEQQASATLRVSFSKYNTREEVDAAMEIFKRVVK